MTATQKTSRVLAALLIAVVAGSGCVRWSHADSHYIKPASIEIARPENNGLVNILSCTLAFSDGQRCKLSGGDRTTVSVHSGAAWVTASSPDPFNPKSGDLAAWQSSRFNFNLNPGETLRLSVEPKSDDSTYTGGWIIKRN